MASRWRAASQTGAEAFKHRQTMIIIMIIIILIIMILIMRGMTVTSDVSVQSSRKSSFIF